jgi:two-component system cell cycle sensor histidine kinase/response regulator CckA
MIKPLQVIHVEDSHDDSVLVKTLLEKDGLVCEIFRVETREELVDALQNVDCDLILSDCTLPQFHGLEALAIARTKRPDVPFIFVSGTIGEETAIKSLQNGATDYVLKQRLSRLAPADRRALTEAEGRLVRNTMETQLRQSRKLEAIGTSVGGLAHDFRNLLQALTMGIELLPLDANNPEAVLRIAERLKRASDRGCHMIEELLLFARKADTNLTAMDVARQIGETMEVLQACLPADISLHLHLEENLPAISADPAQVDRILTNLVMNARDAMPDGGKIMVSTDIIQFDRIPADLWQIKDVPYLRIMISDTGAGMDEAIQSRIFEPFFTTKSAGKGTGLGLSVVFGLMQEHQGFIDLESKVGEGTTFSLFFPLRSDEKIVPGRVHLIAPIRLLGQTSSI